MIVSQNSEIYGYIVITGCLYVNFMLTHTVAVPLMQITVLVHFSAKGMKEA